MHGGEKCRHLGNTATFVFHSMMPGFQECWSAKGFRRGTPSRAPARTGRRTRGAFTFRPNLGPVFTGYYPARTRQAAQDRKRAVLAEITGGGPGK